MTTPSAQPASGAEHQVRLRLPRRPSGFAGGLMLVIGIVLLLDALVTVLWQDPFTAIFAQRDQQALSAQLNDIEREPLPATTLNLVEEAHTGPERMAILAHHLATRTQAGEPLGRIAFDRIRPKYVFVAGTGKQSLKRGPGHYAGNALPGQDGTVAIAGHRTTYLAPFRHIDRLRHGDHVTLTMPYGRFTYSVEGSRIVRPANTGVLKHLEHNRLVLTTCHPVDSAAKRLVLTARLQHAEPRGAALDVKPAPIQPPRI